MKRLFMFYTLFLLLLYIIPAFIAQGTAHTGGNPESLPTLSNRTVSVYFKDENCVKTVNFEEYLLGVVAAEMPANFPLEALKAQAVASRSYVLDKINSGGSKIDIHKGADVCTDSSHCKAWISKEERFKKWAVADAEKNWAKITTAVTETSGEYMTYEGEPITAVFYAISSGTTERAEDVWGGNVPYLQNSDSSLDKNAPDYHTVVEFTKSEFVEKISAEFPDISLTASPSNWYQNENRSSGGAVLNCKIGNKQLKGTDVRRIFGLRSHNYNLTYDDGIFHFDVYGYGHGVGMSQWGAKFYADEGKNYRDILRIYYKGIDFANMPEK